MIYIQKNQDGIPHHFDCACAMYGAMDLGLDYKLITFEDIQSGKWDSLIRSNLFVGSVEFMTEVFKRIGINQPRLPLNNFRDYEEMKLRDFKYERPVFIKPRSIKAFTGFVVDEYSKSMLNTLDPELDIIIQEVLEFDSEWRFYIFRNKIVDIRHYSGILDVNLTAAINNFEKTDSHGFKGFPETFVMDIGFYSDSERYSVIEFNDMWAIGNYGVPNDLYVRMLKERYFDIIKNGKRICKLYNGIKT